MWEEEELEMPEIPDDVIDGKPWIDVWYPVEAPESGKVLFV